MSKKDPSLTQWANANTARLNRVTLGQFVTLVELCENESVAQMGGRIHSSVTNYRQKLHRLQNRLGIGPLTQMEKKHVQPNLTGKRIAGEVRLLLQEIQAAEKGLTEKRSTWVVGAGNTWLQGAIVPALADLSTEFPNWRWQVRSLRAEEISRGLRDGEIHFGFMRVEEAQHSKGIQISRPFDITSYAILAGNSTGAPTKSIDLIRWLIAAKRPLVQQGSTWIHLRKSVGKILGRLNLLEEVTPEIECDTHTLAAATARQSSSWCIVPAPLAFVERASDFRQCLISSNAVVDQMALANYPRFIGKFPDGEAALDALRKAVGRRMKV